MRIAVDALGGDHAPDAVVSGALAAAVKLPRSELILVGQREEIEGSFSEEPPANVSIRESGGAVGMEEEPTAALRSNPDSSVATAARTVGGGEADALFSAGNTGAAVAAALLHVGRLSGCRRPAIATVMTFPQSTALLLDAGATIACRAQDLLNFAILGGVFAERYFGMEDGPRVGLLNVGEEPGKGSDLTREAHGLLQSSEMVRFVGNVEGRDIGRGLCEVVVTDGFTGNVVLKTAEGVSREVLSAVRSAMTESVVSKLAASVLRPRLRGLRDRVDPENQGGSFLLGVRAPVVIGHGNTRARGVENALLTIARTGSGLTETFEEALARPAGERA